MLIINVLPYADDIVLLAPSWRAHQSLLELLPSNIETTDMMSNANKTICMVFNRKDRSKIVLRMTMTFKERYVVCSVKNLNLALKWKTTARNSLHKSREQT
jgi:hypothetical protein